MRMGKLGAGLCVAALLAAMPAAAETVVLRNMTVIDGTGKAAAANSALVMTDGRIAWVGPVAQLKAPEGAKTVDLGGKFVIPGLIDSHVHIGIMHDQTQDIKYYTRENVEADLKTYAAYGVTAVQVLGTDKDLVFDIRKEERAGRPKMARVFTSGQGEVFKGGYGGVFGLNVPVSTPEEARTSVEAYEERNHELRSAMARVVADFESAYLSRNEDMTQAHPRTMMILKPEEPIPSVRFSTFNHRVLWADAKESEQTVVEYMPFSNKETGKLDWVRREQRRESNQPPELEPGEYDVLLSDVESVKIDLYNWKTTEWVDNWNTMQADGQRGMLPYRVRITISVKDTDGKSIKYTSEARIMMQEALLFSPT